MLNKEQLTRWKEHEGFMEDNGEIRLPPVWEHERTIPYLHVLIVLPSDDKDCRKVTGNNFRQSVDSEFFRIVGIFFRVMGLSK